MTVLQKLRLQVILAIVFVLMFIFAVIIGFLDFGIYRGENARVFSFLTILADNGGHMPPRGKNSRGSSKPGTPPNLPAAIPPREVFDFLRGKFALDVRNYFSVEVFEDFSINKLILDFPISYSEDEIYDFLLEIRDSEKKKGFIEDVYFLVKELDSGNMLISLVNRRGENEVLKRLFLYSLQIYILSFISAIFFAWIISGFIVKPVKTDFDKHKQFIADASHELKTPIAVIGANIDVLMSDFPDNKWVSYIKEENERMGHIVQDLLFLARNDSGCDVEIIKEFNLSKLIERSVLPFESVIFEQGKTLDMKIEENMNFIGDENKIKQLIIILVDNALKNSKKDALIRVLAFSEGQKKTVKVYNTGNGIPESEREKIFLRFYRTDYSREKKIGGYGLGLPIAKAIVKGYNGSIYVDSKVGEWAEFIFSIFPKKKHSSKS